MEPARRLANLSMQGSWAAMRQEQEHGAHEVDVLDYVRALERNLYDWHAVHLHLSQLKPHNRRDYQLRIAANEFEGLLRRYQSELFQLGNGDIVFLWQGSNVQDVDAVVLRLRYLFSDDPLVIGAAEPAAAESALVGPGDEAGEPDPAAALFCTWYELERQYDAFRFRLQDLTEELQQGGGPPRAASRPIDLANLARLEASLAGTDLSPLLRRQPICAIVAKAAPQPIFREVYVAMSELARRISPEVDLTADTWLFQHLVQSLDRGVLAALGAGDGQPDEALSINLRLATLLSPDFLAFDRAFRRHHKKEVVIELQLIDIYSELGAYLFIREFVRDRGYRVCIDGLHHLHLPLVNRKRLGADLVKLVWSADLLGDVNGARLDELRAAIKQTGVDRVILCRCDSASAIAWGEALGIRLFQGHYIDARLRAARSPAVAAARRALRERTA